MKRYIIILWLLISSWSQAALFVTEAIEDQATLEVTVLQDWKPSSKEPAIRQKLIEITVCEWWKGQKVRLPVTLNAPVSDVPCENLIIANQSLAKRATLPRGGQLDLLKNKGVGVVLIGMGTIDAMEPKGELHLGMRQKLLETKDPRYTPAWIWGMSQMRALTAALSEPDVYQPKKVLTTGGSKRGVASAAAGIHDARFTAILPVVAPPLGNPGASSYVIGTEPAHLLEIDKTFYRTLDDESIETALRERAERRAANRVSLADARAAGWSEADIEQITDRAWDASRITNHLPELKKRSLDIFYNVGTNDSVTPALLELGKRFPDFPICIIPGGQHGGPATAGYTRRVPLLPEVQANFTTFALHHFFGDRNLIKPPRIVGRFDRDRKTLRVTAIFPDRIEPEKNELWWNINRSEPYTLPFEYDTWQSIPMTKSAPGEFSAEVQLDSLQGKIDYLSLHTHTADDLPLTISSPYRRKDFESATVALIGDSTVTDKAGWGRAFAKRFGDNVTVHNFAMGGRSSKSWLDEGRLDAVRESMPDFVLIQFGHNGQPGKGPKRETNPETTYRDFLKIYIKAAHKMGAVPILLSSVTRRDFTSEGKIRVEPPGNYGNGVTRPLKPWADAAKSVAKETDTAFIDLYQLSVAYHNRIGPEASAAFSPKAGDITHFNGAGADAIAELIVTELKKADPNLAAFLR